jgi:UDP-N-acetyl-D-glucosamine dehydrogenase
VQTDVGGIPTLYNFIQLYRGDKLNMKTVGVIGLGYVGLPLAVQAVKKGYTVIGVDLSQELVDKVNNRQSPYVNDPRFDKALAAISTPDSLVATTDYSGLDTVDTIVICVPTPTENNVPDISFVTKAASQIAIHLRKGQLISLESTVSPGITRDEVLPILEKVSGLTVGKDFYLAHCPERIDPGNDTYFVGNLNRVVGGITDACTQRAAAFYESVVDAKIIPLASPEEAEFVKSWENSHRNVMIALANSAAIICDAVGMNIDNILMGLQSKVDQFGLKLATPGIGPGGHCIPEDIHYVIKKARQNGIDTRFLDDAAELNDKMPKYALQKLSEMTRDNNERLSDLRVALLGLAYKPNIADLRRSPAIEVGYELLRSAKSVIVHDPFVDIQPTTIKGAEVADSLKSALKGADIVFIGAGHDVYRTTLTPKVLKQAGVRYVLDGRNCLKYEDFSNNDIQYRGIGR